MLERVWTQLLVGFLCSMVIIAESSTANPSQESHKPNYTSLSGVWEGTMKWLQKGQCTIDSPGDPIRITLDVTPDGSFTAVVNLKNRKANENITLAGVFNKNLKLFAEGEKKASCWGRGGMQVREYKINYGGQVRGKKGQFLLEIEGIDEGCPEQGCVFTLSFRVKQK